MNLVSLKSLNESIKTAIKLKINCKVLKNFIFFLFLLISLFNCSKSKNVEEPKPNETEGCKIVGRVYETTSYDALGNITSNPAKWERNHTLNGKLAPVKTEESYQSSDGGKIVIKRNYITFYEYDADDLLTSTKSNGIYTSWQGGGYVSSYDTVSNFSKYQDKRLVEVSAGKSSATSKYEYSTDGKLIKFITTGDNGNKITKTYSNGVLTDVTESKPSPDLEMTYNKMGFQSVAKYKDILLEYRYSYDIAGNLIKREMYSKDILQSYADYVYNAPNLQRKADINFKGHPIIPSLVGADARLLKQTTTFSRRANGGDFVKTGQSDYVYEFNSTGYYNSLRVNSITYKTDGLVQSSTKSVETFIYQNCK